MIVIATNNGKKHLSELIKSIDNLRIDEKVLVVDTGSSDEEHLIYLEELKNRPDTYVSHTPYHCYDTGAYIWAYNNYVDEVYHFIHDSISIKNGEFFNIINEELKMFDVVSYIRFEFAGYGDHVWQNIFLRNVGSCQYPFGIFGPMFSVKRKTFDNLPIKDITMPSNKTEQTAFEGIWPMLFLKNRLSIKTLDDYDPHKINNDGYKNFRKKILIRK